MKEFFVDETIGIQFNQFDIQHTICLLATLISIFFILLFQNKIKLISLKKIKILRIITATIIILNMIIYRGSYLIYGKYILSRHLSLYLCHIIGYVYAADLLLNGKKAFRKIYFLIFISPLFSIIYPDLQSGVDCYLFYSSFISHNFVIISSVFFVCAYNVKPNLKDGFVAYVIAVVIVLFTYMINYDFNTVFNMPKSLFYEIINKYNIVPVKQYLILIICGIIGLFVGELVLILKKLLGRTKKNEIS